MATPTQNTSRFTPAQLQARAPPSTDPATVLEWMRDRGGYAPLAPETSLTLRRRKSDATGAWGPDVSRAPLLRVPGRCWDNRARQNVEGACDVDLADVIAALRVAQETYGEAWTQIVEQALRERRESIARTAEAY